MEMTQEWIRSYNQKCAEFLGYVNTTPTDKDFNIYENEKGITIGNKIYTMLETMSMEFHSDWNWIMEVVEKIAQCYEDEGDALSEMYVVNLEIHTPKQYVIHQIDQFIDWYNKNK